jgi:hypothetical protein
MPKNEVEERLSKSRPLSRMPASNQAKNGSPPIMPYIAAFIGKGMTGYLP